jgi:hypothetical protein
MQSIPGGRRHSVARMAIRNPNVPEDAGNRRGSNGVDDDFAARGYSNVGAWIIGRNMFGSAVESRQSSNTFALGYQRRRSRQRIQKPFVQTLTHILE